MIDWLIKQILCDFLPQLRFWLLDGFHEACFDKASLAAIIEYCKKKLVLWTKLEPLCFTLTGTTHILITSSWMVADAHAIFFHYRLIFLHCFDCLLLLILCFLAGIHAVLLDDFPCTQSKFFSSGNFFHYGRYLLIHSY